MKDQEILQLMHSPEECAALLMTWAQRCRDHPGVRLGIDAVDKVVNPIRPGGVTTIIGRPGHGKTSLLAMIADRHAKQIRDPDEIVVFVTAEQAVEELEATLLGPDEITATSIIRGEVDLENLEYLAQKRSRKPIWMIGYSTTKAGVSARMTTRAIYRATYLLQHHYSKKVALMLVDYLQIIPVEDVTDKRESVSLVPNHLKLLSLSEGVPIILAVQSSRDVDSRANKLPRMDDAQWSSAIEQASDAMFSIWMPARTEPPGEPITVGAQTFAVTPELFFFKLLKQRHGPGSQVWALYFEPQYLKLAELDTHTDVSW